MVLASAGRHLSEEDLCGLLETEPTGTPVLNLLLLAQRLPGCQSDVRSATVEELTGWNAQGIAPIVIVSTAPLAYWQTDCLHALVVVDVTATVVHVHDPAFPTAPLVVPREAFEAAWRAVGQVTGILTLAP